MARKKKSGGGGPSGSEWLTTYSDMVTLMLCFFVIFFNPDDVTQAQLDALSTSMQTGGIGAMPGGMTVSVGRNADLGHTVSSLPAADRGTVMGNAYRKAVSLFTPEIYSNKIKVTHEERGVVITLAGDTFFRPASARVNIETSREILNRLATYLVSNDLAGRKFRIEGHTDDVDVDPVGPWEDNWQLSSERSRAVLRYLAAFGVDEKRFQIAGFANTVPISNNETEEGRALNRRVDVIILDDAHL